MRRFVMLGVLVGVFLSGCASQAGYLVKQGGYLLRYSTGTRGVDAMLADPSTAETTRAFLQRVRDIKAYAVGTVGLKNNGSYTRYKAVDRDHLVDVVSAADAVSFTAYMWSYPILGKLPYKGFYERPDADAEAARLKGEGWDVITRPVDAFSTLGFTKDPLYSFMEKYSAFDIASLIIHEQTHATLFLKGQPAFNEALATFVGDEGAFQWLRDRYGADSSVYRDARDQYADQQAFTGLLRDLSKTLADVYGRPIDREEKLARKTRLIQEFNASLLLRRGTIFRTGGYRKIGPLALNNAYLSLYSLYSDDVPLLREYWEKKCGADLRAFIAAAQALSKHGDVKAQMREGLDAG